MIAPRAVESLGGLSKRQQCSSSERCTAELSTAAPHMA